MADFNRPTFFENIDLAISQNRYIVLSLIYVFFYIGSVYEPCSQEWDRRTTHKQNASGHGYHQHRGKKLLFWASHHCNLTPFSEFCLLHCWTSI